MSDIFNQLITDRKNDTVYYNVSDLNRVEEAVKELSYLLTAEGYYINADAKTNWAVTDFPYIEEMERYLNNVKKCERQFVKTNIPLPITMENLGYNDANNIEKVLQLLHSYLELLKAGYKHSGTCASAQTVLPQNVYYMGRTWAEMDALGWTWDVWDTKTWFTLLY